MDNSFSEEEFNLDGLRDIVSKMELKLKLLLHDSSIYEIFDILDIDPKSVSMEQLKGMTELFYANFKNGVEIGRAMNNKTADDTTANIFHIFNN